jgi:hypothetical protein
MSAGGQDLFDEFFPETGAREPQPLFPPPLPDPRSPVATPPWPATEDELPGWLPQPPAEAVSQPPAAPAPGAAAPGASGADARGSASAVPILEVPPVNPLANPIGAPLTPPVPWGGAAPRGAVASDFDRLIRQAPSPQLPGAATAGGGALPPAERKVPSVLWHLLSYLLIAAVVLAGLVFPRFSVPSGVRLPERADSLLAAPAVDLPGR